MTPELRLVRYFVAVAQERHVTRAAERLHIAQPSLSAAVKQLEAQLGVALLDRATKEVVLTPAAWGSSSGARRATSVWGMLIAPGRWASSPPAPRSPATGPSS